MAAGSLKAGSPPSARRKCVIHTAPSLVARRTAPSRCASTVPGRALGQFPPSACAPCRYTGRPSSSSSTPGAPSAACTLRSTVALSSRAQAMVRSACRMSGRARPRAGGCKDAGACARSPAAMRCRVSSSTATAACVTSLRYRLLLVASRIAKPTLAHTGPASNSPLASIAVTPQSASPSRIAQSSADGPRSPATPGWMTMQRTRCHTASGMRRLRKGATISSGCHSATASSVTRSLMSNSTVTSCPACVSSLCRRCARLLKACVRNRMRIDRRAFSRCAAAARR